MAEPQAEHRWLRQLVGAWRYEVECTMGPGQPMSKSSGTETVRTLGGLWVVAEGRGEMPGGGPATMLLTLGFDPRRGRFVGSWAGSMMTHLWVYDGALDAAGKVLTLDTEGPDFTAEGKHARYQDVIILEDDDHRLLTGRRLGDDGRWHVLMTARYHRAKG
ncbi:hypothetical protein GCM10010964_00420 [Caldovatus sediminis]|uniref:DUF1579 domain-containing protein n=1 Tax=Caldovatus sediminis TaxID=2041189 RepID=A0A8J2Z7M1_9PROT|nr:DUF1579 domain-containing protein [Caldovatus sediminis]GGG16015.1 hypothetical protein GCM10010964_00420 [Caldovatus sediminis]